MNGAHWTTRDCIEHLYGIGPDAAHLDSCGECRARVGELEVKRWDHTRDSEVSGEFLAAQRRSIFRKLGREPRKRARFAPALVMGVLTLMVVLIARAPWRSPESPLATSPADSQLFSEIYALEQDLQPKAAETVQALFEED